MIPAPVVFEQRRYPRVQLHLPVRLRWLGPLGSRLEIHQSLDVSRGGMLIYRPDECTKGARVWVTFPFNPAAPEPQPETAARVVRVKTTPAGGHLLSLALEATGPRVGRPILSERRASPRIPLSIPFSIRAGEAPWAEEAMTLDVSAAGVRFETSLLYQENDKVRPRLEFGHRERAQEETAHVVRVEQVPGAVEQRVSIAWEHAAKSELEPQMDTDKH